MRTNVYVDEELIQECQELTQLKTKREIIDSALKEFIKLCKRRKMLELEGKIDWEGNLDEMRSI
jgi:Arc/MetJ family transcription regulator